MTVVATADEAKREKKKQVTALSFQKYSKLVSNLAQTLFFFVFRNRTSCRLETTIMQNL